MKTYTIRVYVTIAANDDDEAETIKERVEDAIGELDDVEGANAEEPIEDEES